MKLSDAQALVSVVAHTPLVDGAVALMKGAGTLMTGAGTMITRISEDIDFGKVGDLAIEVVRPSNVIKSVSSVGGIVVGSYSGAALGAGLGFAFGGPAGAAIGYGVGILSGAGTGAIIGYTSGKAVTHVLELPEKPPDVTIGRDENSKVIEAPYYSVRDLGGYDGLEDI